MWGWVSRGFSLSRGGKGKSRVCPPWEGVSPHQHMRRSGAEEWLWGCSKAPRSPHKAGPKEQTRDTGQSKQKPQTKVTNFKSPE